MSLSTRITRGILGLASTGLAMVGLFQVTTGGSHIVIRDGHAPEMPAVAGQHLDTMKATNPILDTLKMTNPVLDTMKITNPILAGSDL